MKTKKKNKKARLSALLLMMLLTIVMLATSTYAWFTANKTVTIEGIDVKVSTSSGLQISTDAKEWKTSIANADITTPANWTANTNQFPSTLVPVSTAGKIDSATKKIAMFSGDIGTDGTNFTLTSSQLTEAKGTAGKFIAFDIFLRAEAAGDIYLTDGANVVKKTGTTETGLKNSARVGFLNQGTADTTTDYTALQTLNTGSGGEGITNADITIWEPNSDVHTPYGVAAALEYYGTTTTEGPGASALSYRGINSEITTPVQLKRTGDDTTHFTTVTTTKTIATPTTYTKIFTLASGVTKMRVYLWVEGQDVDCENNASGADITYNIVLSQNSAAPAQAQT